MFLNKLRGAKNKRILLFISPSPCPLPKGGEEELIRFLPAQPVKTLSKKNYSFDCNLILEMQFIGKILTKIALMIL